MHFGIGAPREAQLADGMAFMERQRAFDGCPELGHIAFIVSLALRAEWDQQCGYVADTPLGGARAGLHGVRGCVVGRALSLDSGPRKVSSPTPAARPRSAIPGHGRAKGDDGFPGLLDGERCKALRTVVGVLRHPKQDDKDKVDPKGKSK